MPRLLCPLQKNQGFPSTAFLGRGGFGPVYKGLLEGMPVAVKCMDSNTQANQVRSMRMPVVPTLLPQRASQSCLLALGLSAAAAVSVGFMSSDP